MKTTMSEMMFMYVWAKYKFLIGRHLYFFLFKKMVLEYASDGLWEHWKAVTSIMPTVHAVTHAMVAYTRILKVRLVAKER